VLGATALIAFSPMISRWLRSRDTTDTRLPRPLWPWSGLVGVYSGYFGAGQGIVLLALFGIRYDTDIQRANAAKNAFAATANLVAALVFLVTGHVDIAVAACVALGAIPGGFVGGLWARRLPDAILRGLVIAVGVAATIYLFGFR
ncbi:MAG: sulfite exporter TauE/SafE family protein, partial [Candidatus Nanopelagicales bacterium]